MYIGHEYIHVRASNLRVCTYIHHACVCVYMDMDMRIYMRVHLCVFGLVCALVFVSVCRVWIHTSVTVFHHKKLTKIELGISMHTSNVCVLSYTCMCRFTISLSFYRSFALCFSLFKCTYSCVCLCVHMKLCMCTCIQSIANLNYTYAYTYAYTYVYIYKKFSHPLCKTLTHE